MGRPSLDTRRRMVEAYETGKCKTYQAVADAFGFGVATVSRNLRRKRQSGDVLYKPHGHRPRQIDRGWLQQYARDFPDTTRQQCADAWYAHSAVRVSRQTTSNALAELKWTYKKTLVAVERDRATEAAAFILLKPLPAMICSRYKHYRLYADPAQMW